MRIIIKPSPYSVFISKPQRIPRGFQDLGNIIFYVFKYEIRIFFESNPNKPKRFIEYQK